MKLSTRSNKQELATVLGANAKAVQKKDKSLFDRMAYASKMFKQDESKVTKKDLLDLVKEVQTALGNAFVTPALAEETEKAQPKAENSVKGKTLKSKTAKAEKTEAPAEDTSEQEEKSESKGVKAPKKSAKAKAEGVTVLNEVDTPKTVQLAKMFPKTITAGEDTYEIAQDIKTMKDLHTALENDEDIVFAYYWTKRHLKQFPYFNSWLGQPKQFDNDLDICTTLYVSDNEVVSYQVSLYTEAIYTILPEDLEETDGVRTANGIEFQIYRKA